MSIIPNPVSAFVEAYKPILIGAAVVLLIIALCALAYCSGGSGVRHADDQETIQLQTHVIAADGNAADARVADTVQIQNQQREIEDAVQNTSSVDDARRARGCVILRQQNRSAAATAAGC
jgi:hypothetical protein